MLTMSVKNCFKHFVQIDKKMYKKTDSILSTTGQLLCNKKQLLYDISSRLNLKIEETQHTCASLYIE